MCALYRRLRLLPRLSLRNLNLEIAWRVSYLRNRAVLKEYLAFFPASTQAIDTIYAEVGLCVSKLPRTAVEEEIAQLFPYVS